MVRLELSFERSEEELTNIRRIFDEYLTNSTCAMSSREIRRFFLLPEETEGELGEHEPQPHPDGGAFHDAPRCEPPDSAGLGLATEIPE